MSINHKNFLRNNFVETFNFWEYKNYDKIFGLKIIDKKWYDMFYLSNLFFFEKENKNIW